MTTEKVQGTPDGTVAPEKEVTPAGGVADTKATPTPQPADADIEKVRQKYEQDINRMKSTFQKQLSDREKEWRKTQEQLNEELEQARVTGMDETQRKAYEQTATARRIAKLETQLNELSTQKNEVESMFSAHSYFLQQGVPADQLVTDAGYEALWNSGMNYITTEFQRLKSNPSSPKPAAPSLPSAPEVVTTTSTPAYTGTTWPELIKRYGSEEEVYRLIETQQLDPSILPSQ